MASSTGCRERRRASMVLRGTRRGRLNHCKSGRAPVRISPQTIWARSRGLWRRFSGLPFLARRGRATGRGRLEGLPHRGYAPVWLCCVPPLVSVPHSLVVWRGPVLPIFWTLAVLLPDLISRADLRGTRPRPSGPATAPTSPDRWSGRQRHSRKKGLGGMKRGLLLLVVVLVLAGFSGCLREQTCPNGGDEPCVQGCGRTACCWPPCNACRGREHCARPGPALQPQQPPYGAITYPYYTLRGPRDFLERSPSPIGP